MTSRRSRDRLTPREKVLMAAVIVAAASSAAMLYSSLSATDNEPGFVPADLEELSTDGFVEVSAEAGVADDRGVVSLTGGCYRMTAGSDVYQAESIRDGIEGVVGQRPNAHDISKDAFGLLGVDVLMVKVTELRDNNFHGRIILQQGSTILNLDSRPSDGIAIAVRTGAKIYFNETLLEEQGRYICQ